MPLKIVCSERKCYCLLNFDSFRTNSCSSWFNVNSAHFGSLMGLNNLPAIVDFLLFLSGCLARSRLPAMPMCLGAVPFNLISVH